MYVRQFASESYPRIARGEAWQDLLAQLRLRSAPSEGGLETYGSRGQGEVYATSSLDLAMKDAFRKTRRFLMEMRSLNEDEAVAVISAGVDFGVTQVVDGNWGVHAIVRKSLFKV
jgi:acetamidase/formamidase